VSPEAFLAFGIVAYVVGLACFVGGYRFAMRDVHKRIHP
jgi:hypothetical protein